MPELLLVVGLVLIGAYGYAVHQRPRRLIGTTGAREGPLPALGSARRRGGRRAHAARVRAALEIAHHCGAIALRNAARDELVRAGLRPRRFASTGPEALTPSERRVADLAASGAANRAIAQSLFVSLKTVKAHLSSVYRKLGVSARWQLADRLAATETGIAAD